jgi:hypothetical protein
MQEIHFYIRQKSGEVKLQTSTLDDIMVPAKGDLVTMDFGKPKQYHTLYRELSIKQNSNIARWDVYLEEL